MSTLPPATRLRYVHEVAGAIVLVTFLAALVVLGLTGRAQRWFEPVVEVRVRLPMDGSFGLREGSEVLVLGTTVGAVDQLTIDQDGITAVVTLRKAFAHFVRADSRAIVRRTFVVAGDAFLEITRGTGAPLGPGATIIASADLGPRETMQLVIDQIRIEAIPTVQAIRKAVEESTALATQLRDPAGPLQQIIGSAQSLSSKLDKGDGLVGRLIADPALADDAERLMRNTNVSVETLVALLDDVSAAAASLQKIAAQVEGQSDQIPEIVTSAKNILNRTDALLADVQTIAADGTRITSVAAAEAENFRGLAIQAQETLRQIERLIEGVQQHWLIRDYVPQPLRRPRLPASAAATEPGTPASGGGR